MATAVKEWRPISEYEGEGPLDRVDLWLTVPASPRSMGISDAFRVTDAYLKDGGWYHFVDGKEMELYKPYVTHFMPRPDGPNGETFY